MTDLAAAKPARPRRERPKAIRLTDAAAARIAEVMARADKPYIGVRLGLKNAGCAGMAYTMSYAEAQDPLDELVEDKGVKVLIDPKAIMFLIGTEMDYVTGKLESKFVFKNPNETEACGCGESVAIKPVVEQ
jgi:iron-sulfur cluster assembly protein